MVPKLGVSGEEELAFGAIATGGVRLLNVDLIVGISKNMINAITSQELKELERRERLIEGIASD